MTFVLQAAGKTDIGRVRKNNEDQFIIAELIKHLNIVQTSLSEPPIADHPPAGAIGHLLVVADGMGGAAGGEVASGLAVETITWYVTRTLPWFYRYQDGREPELEAELVKVVEACQKAFTDAAGQFPRMGTTLTMAYVLWPRVYVVHVGDSRCYFRRDRQFVRVTKDHTVAQRAVDEGLISAAEAESSPLNNQLWNYLGCRASGVSPDIYHATLQEGDELLLCSDGLTHGCLLPGSW